MIGFWLAWSLALGSVGQDGGGRHVLIVSGLGGEPAYRDTFHAWGAALYDAATQRWDVPTAHAAWFAERPARDSARIAGPPTRERILAHLASIADHAGPDDVVLIVLIGHGSRRGNEARLAVPGPDLAPGDLAAALAALPTQTVVVVNAASGSAGFVPPLSGARRVIVAAAAESERNATRFGGFFVEALTGEAADADKDTRVSIWEAFDYARRAVARDYERDNLLLSEHAVLDDDGDGAGTHDFVEGAPDGRLARSVFLDGRGVVGAAAAADTALVRLYKEKRRLEAAIAALRERRDTLGESAYEAQLETLLLDLASVNRAVRERGGG